jgi:dTDP-4-amino-4,6-dideoxygalactose transaminase
MNYEGWDQDYLENKQLYLDLFDKVMQEDNEKNVEFLEKKIAKYVGRKHAVAVNSATDALFFSLKCYDVGPGDEVLVSDFSWISSASCILMARATPVFCDIDLDSYHISFDEIKKKTTSKTKALIYTHLFGNMTETKEIEKYCKDNNIIFIEDAAQSLGSKYKDRYAGAIGDISSFSFNHNKVISGISGGGMIFTDIDSTAEYLRKIRKHGKGKDYETLGYNSKMFYMNAVYIEMRFDRINKLQSRRIEVANKYHKELKDLPVTIQVANADLVHNYHKYVVRFENKETRDEVKNKLNAKIHYDPPISKNSMFNLTPCTNAQKASDTVLSLPCHPYVTEEEINQTCMIIGIIA